MQNETQNQDTNTQVAQEEAPVQTETQPQQPVAEEAPAAPQQAMDDTQAATSEVVHDEPGIPQQEQQQGIAVGEYDPSSPEGEPVSEAAVSGLAEEPARDDMLGIGLEDISADPSVSDLVGNDNVSPTVEPFDLGSIEVMFEEISPTVSEDYFDEDEYLEGDANIPVEDDWSWDSEPSDTEAVSEELPPEAVSMPADKIVKPVPTDQAQPPDSEAAAPLSPEAVSMPVDKIVDPVPTDQGVEIPEDAEIFIPEDESNPAEVDYQAVLHDLDSGNIDKVRDFIENLSRGDEEDQDATQGGYDGSGIAGGLDLDEDGVFDQLETNPDDTSEEKYTYDEDAYEDAEDSFEDFQDALQEGDEEDLAEALEELQDYLGGFDKGDGDQENDSHNHGDQEDEQDENEIRDEAGIKPEMSEDEDYAYDEDAYEDAEDALEDLQHALKHGDEEDRTKALEELQGYLNGFNKDNEEEEYTYDEGAYKDAEGALKDLQHALQHGDEEERAEALEKLQGYLGGFDRGDDEEQDGTETQDDQDHIQDRVDADGDVPREDMPKAESDPAEVDYQAVLDDLANGNLDKVKAFIENLRSEEEDQDTTGDSEHDSDFDTLGGADGDGVKDWMVLDFNGDGIEDGKEDSDGDGLYDWQDSDSEAPDASGAAVSGPAAVGGAAVGAGAAAGEAGDLDEDLVKDVRDFFGDIFGGGEAPAGAGAAAGAGTADKAIGAATEKAGGAIDGALGIEGSGKILDQVANGNFDEALDGATELAGGEIDEALGIEGSGKVLENVLDGDFDEALDAAGEVLDDVVDDIGDKVEDFFDFDW